MNNKNTRLAIFKSFSRNLEQIKNENMAFEFKPDFANGYICPICMGVFFEEDLSTNLSTHLTLEHVPPDSLGGKASILTCNKCNSKSGSTLDAALLRYLEEMDLKEFRPNATKAVGLEFGDAKVNGRVRVDVDGQVNIHFDKERSEPKQFASLIAQLSTSKMVLDMFSGYNFTPTEKKIGGKISFFNQPDRRKVEIALLRIAHLLIFSIFGNSAILSPMSHRVSKQIRFPEQNILGNNFIFNMRFPNDILGVNIIKEPKELRAFLVVFNLKTKSCNRQFAIILPGPSAPGIGVYKNYNEVLKNLENKESLPFEIEHLPTLNYVNDSKLAHGYFLYWQKFAVTA